MRIRLPSILRERLATLAAVAAVILGLCVGVHRHGSVYQGWKTLRVPSLSPLFADTRTITHSIDCLLAGQDPFFVRSFDPWNRVYNYPPIWLDLRYLGVTSHSSNLLGSIFALTTIAAFLILFRARTWTAAVIVFFAIISKAILFAVERGNTDQVIFFLLVAGFFLIDRQRIAVRTALRSALIVCLTILKIFPVAAAVVLVRNRKSTLIALLTVILSLATLKLTSGSRLALVLANTPQDTYVSFGSFPFFSALIKHISGSVLGLIQNHVQVASVFALLLAVFSIAAGLRFRDPLNRLLPPLDFESSRGGIAAAGLAIYCLAFVRGSGYDYRLIFLMGPLACLVEDLNLRKSLRRLPAAVLIVLLLWKPTDFCPAYEVIDGLVFVTACAWLGTSLFDRLRSPSSAPRPQLSV